MSATRLTSVVVYGPPGCGKSMHAAALSRIVREAAVGLTMSLSAGQPVTTKLIVASMAERLRDEHVIADLVQRSMRGENAFAALTREIIREEAEEIAQVALDANVEEPA